MVTTCASSLLPARIQADHAAHDATFGEGTVATGLGSVTDILLQVSSPTNRRLPIITTTAERSTSPQCIPNRSNL